MCGGFPRIVPPAFAYLACAALLGLVLGWIPMNVGQLAASLFLSKLLRNGQWNIPGTRATFGRSRWRSTSTCCGRPCSRGAAYAEDRILAPALACGVALWRGLDTHFAWVATLAPSLKDSVARTDYRLDGLLWGCALAFVWQSDRGRAWIAKLCNPWSLAAFLPGVALLAYFRPAGHAALLAILLPLCVGCTVTHPQARIARLLEARPVVRIGRLSYSLYLWQQLFLPARGVPAPFEALQVFPLNLALAFGAAAASYHLVERPAIAWGRALLSRPQPVPPVPAYEAEIEEQDVIAQT